MSPAPKGLGVPNVIDNFPGYFDGAASSEDSFGVHHKETSVLDI